MKFISIYQLPLFFPLFQFDRISFYLIKMKNFIYFHFKLVNQQILQNLPIRQLDQLMNSVNKRKQLVNQLRKAHFPFGFQDNKPHNQSQYGRKYIQHEMQPNGQDKSNSRKTNIRMGDQNSNINSYKSQFTDNYPEYQLHKKSVESGNNNTQSKNVVFGYDNNQFRTNYNSDFNRKLNQQGKVKPIDQRKPNIQLGDSLTDFTTTYNKLYQQKQLTPNHLVHNMQSRKSNLILGNDKGNFQTQNSAAYCNVHTSKYEAHKPLQSSNVDLGSDKVQYCSQNKNNYCNKDADKQLISKQTIRDFRSAHFKFGFPQQNAVCKSQNQANFYQKQIKLEKGQGNRQSNINLNIDGNLYYQSSYSKQFQNWGVQKKQDLSKKGRIDNVLIGTDYDPKNHFISQAKQNYNKKNILRSHAIKHDAKLSLGDSKNDFTTHNSLVYGDKFGQLDGSKLSAEQISKMKCVNVVTGFQNSTYNLSSKEYGKQWGNKGQLPKSVIEGMRNTNIVLQTIPVSIKNTQYKESFPFKKIYQ